MSLKSTMLHWIPKKPLFTNLLLYFLLLCCDLIPMFFFVRGRQSEREWWPIERSNSTRRSIQGHPLWIWNGTSNLMPQIDWNIQMLQHGTCRKNMWSGVQSIRSSAFWFMVYASPPERISKQKSEKASSTPICETRLDLYIVKASPITNPVMAFWKIINQWLSKILVNKRSFYSNNILPNHCLYFKNNIFWYFFGWEKKGKEMKREGKWDKKTRCQIRFSE